jgi:hypothetical protein
VSAHRIFLTATLLAAGLAASARAQSTDPAAPAAPPADSTPANVAGPDLYLLPDASGALRRVLGYKYEDFLSAWRAAGAGERAHRPPAFALASVDADITAEDDSAKVQVRAEVELKTTEWVEVPLELAALVVSSTNIESGSAQEFISFDPARKAFVAWLKGKPGDKRKLVLDGRVALRRDGEAQRLELTLPPGATTIVHLNGVRGEVDVESENALLEAEPAEADGGQWRIEGVKGRLALRMGPRSAPVAERAASLDALVEQLVRLEPGRVAYDVRLAINPLGEAIQSARVRLPRGTTITSPTTAPDYDVVPLADASADGDGRPVVEIRFRHAGAELPEVRLAAERSQTPADANGAVEIGSFDVIGAFRQQGAAALLVSEQLHAHFDLAGRIEQVKTSELPDGLASASPTAAFSTSGPWRLTAHTQPRQRRIRATPRYDLHLGAAGATMDVVLDYQLAGGRTFELRIDLRGWELSEQPIESGGAVELTEQHVTPEQILVLPLKDPAAQQVRLRFSLRREAGLGSHDLPFPEAVGALMLPGALNVTCDEAWRTTPRLDASTGIGPAPAAATSAEATGVGPAGAAPATPLRLQTLLPQARLAVEVDRRERAIEASSRIHVRMNGVSAQVEQRIDYNVRYQPATEVAAIVANELVGNEAFEVLLDGRPVSGSDIDVLPLANGATGAAGDKLRLVAKLPRPTIGRVELLIRSATALEDDQRTGAAMTALPLATLEQAARSTASIAVGGDGYRVGLWPVGADAAWSVVPIDALGPLGAVDAAALHVEASKPVDVLPLRLEPAGIRDVGDLRVDATWAQTWFAGGMRQDRFVFRFHTTGAVARVQLPADMRRQTVETLVDGVVAPGEQLPSGELLVPLPPADNRPSHTLELRRQTPARLGSWETLRASFPRMASAGGGSPAVWQLVLPREIVVVGAPPGMSADYRLGWSGYQWGRQPTQSQADLEIWTGATMAPAPSGAVSQYVFTAFELPQSVEVATVRRIWLVVVGGLAALALGLAWLHTRVARSAVFWLAVCVAAGAALAVFPEGALLIGQTVAIGGALTLLSWAVQWVLASPPRPRLVPSTALSSVASHTATTQPWISETPGSSAVAAASGASLRASGSSP